MNARNAKSPCVDICKLDDNDLCLGCFRSRDEIARWSQLGEFARGFINETAAERKRLHLQKITTDQP